MKIIGGEIEKERDDLHYYFTDSGRSSLRLILRSGLNKKHFLLPDFLCPVIVDILKEEKTSYEFYHIEPDLSINWDKIYRQNFDVLYVINYFGKKYQNLKLHKEQILLEDNAFFYKQDRPANIVNWISFNSYRKVSYLADASLVKSTLPLDSNLILSKQPSWAKMRYKAKEIKELNLREETPNSKNENDYLTLIKLSEEELAQRKTILVPSYRSLYYLQLFDDVSETKIRTKNYYTLQGYLGVQDYAPKDESNSHFIFKTFNRQAIKEHLFRKQVFLPSFWPIHPDFTASQQINELYNSLLVIPTDSRYKHAEMLYIAKLIHEILSP